MTKRRNLAIDIDQVLLAMDTPGDLMFEMTQYLDVETGRILLVSSEYEDEEVDQDEVENNPQRYAVVPQFESRDDYDLMVEFAESIDEDDIREKLVIALDGKGAFARFRDVVHPHSDLRARWDAMISESQLERAVAWLHELGIEPEYEVREVRPTQSEPATTRKKNESPTIGLLELVLLGGKTELSSGRVYRHVALPTPSDARRVFKTVARDICAFHGIGWRKRFIQGKNDFHQGSIHLEIQNSRVELSMEVSRELWAAFYQ